MDYEKKYNEALERAKKQKYDYQKELDKTDKNSQLAGLLRAGISAIDMAFPELSESEDERMLQTIIKGFKNWKSNGNVTFNNTKVDDILVYLEKQKEQIPYIDFVIKPHKGNDTNPYDMRVSEAQEYAINRGFGIPFNDGEVYVDERHMTQTIGNILRWADEHPKEQKPAEWTLPKDFEEAVYKVANFISPFDSQEELRKVSHRFAEQLLSLAKKELDNPAEWSEEDENILDGIIVTLDRLGFAEYCKSSRDEDIEEERFYYKEIQCLKKLKSLRHQTHWKPSEEQMNALLYAMSFVSPATKESVLLSEIYEQLKKLM